MDMRTEPHWPDRSARWRPSASAAACGTGETQGLAARVPGAGNAGINGTTNSEILLRQFFLCERVERPSLSTNDSGIKCLTI